MFSLNKIHSVLHTRLYKEMFFAHPSYVFNQQNSHCVEHKVVQRNTFCTSFSLSMLGDVDETIY